MSRLETRYRRLLRLLPAWYRAEREDEMVGTFLAGRGDGADDLDNEYGWPGWPETWAVLALATRTRFAADHAPRRAVLVGDAVRFAAVVALALGAAVELGLGIAALVRVATATGPVEGTELLLTVLAGAGAVVLGFVLLAAGRLRQAKTLVGAAVGLSLVELALRVRRGVDLPSALWSPLANMVPLWVAAACLVAGFHRAAPRPAGGPWLPAAGAGAAVVLAWQWPALGLVTPTDTWLHLVFVDPGPLVVAATAGLAVAGLAGRLPAGWAGGLVVVALAWLPDRVDAVRVMAAHAELDEAGAGLVTMAVVQVAVLVAVAALLAVRARRELRRLPATGATWASRDAS
jgi:hypothetical protein